MSLKPLFCFVFFLIYTSLFFIGQVRARRTVGVIYPLFRLANNKEPCKGAPGTL